MLKGKSLRAGLAVAGIILIAANLRAPITSVGPVLSEISSSLGLSTVQAGMLTTIPVLAFGLLSGLVSRLTRYFRVEAMLLASLALLTLGLFIRPAGPVALLFAGTALVGCGITVGNVLMPAYIKLNFPAKLGLMTGLYAGFMNLFAALASGFSIRLGQVSGLGWKGSLGVWAIMGMLAAIVWLPQVVKDKETPTQGRTAQVRRSLWRSSPLAWQITAYMGLQSILFYSLIAWLPEMLRDWGMPPGEAGWVLSYIQLAQLPVVFAGPVIAARMKNQAPLIWVIGISLVAGFLGILFWKTTFIIPSAILIGIALGLAFSLAMIFLSLRSRDGQDASALSGMAQSFGYLFAASGPLVFGILHDLSGGWIWPIAFLLLMTLALLLSGLGSARDRFV
ncbi:CP family cyanate transporter-like MFS transporter [Anseongella ginsenosidimutans]|uniref:CP family cyanate transporter-like MFS transporter n=1 Tax=Anseongella ginsenosidimutans TaxID=496056 RepID=A0A4R3KU36_9SPHI|nr:MFS transporter [Anseongella ginsenosidimutans]QEC51552.1 MFS transporter [Anseongella ginsenosidimutans]TCS88877.1 CP family cyanate transporter-like MFS transporter [Anseongella ginsenosidimutans]